MNWVDAVVVLCVVLAILAVIFYKLYPLLFKKKKVSRKAKELIKDYNKAKKRKESNIQKEKPSEPFGK